MSAAFNTWESGFVFFGVLHALMLTQEVSRPRHDLVEVQPLYQGSQIVSNDYAEPGTMGLPQQDRGHVMAAAGRNAASREMLRVSFSYCLRWRCLRQSTSSPCITKFMLQQQ